MLGHDGMATRTRPLLLQAGDALDERWRLVRVLGDGGTATVYEAVHRNGRRAAIKVLSRSAERNPNEARRLATTEATIANRLAHPAFVEVFDDGVTPSGIPYLVMELLEGVTLEQLRRAEGGTIPLARALPLLEGLLEALAALHDAGIHHRDVKPDNVFVLEDGRVKVLDYGLASDEVDVRPTTAWAGTPGYMAPEQARGEWWRVDALCDQWSAAATAFTVLTGRLVHKGRTPAELVRIASTADVELGESGLPEEIVAVFARALSSERDARWPDLHAMLAALRGVATNGFHYGSRIMRTIRPLPTGDSATRLFRFTLSEVIEANDVDHDAPTPRRTIGATIRPTTLPAFTAPDTPRSPRAAGPPRRPRRRIRAPRRAASRAVARHRRRTRPLAPDTLRSSWPMSSP
jgi:eukaryotic-like serine/threonine-protein kinase